MEKVKKEGIKSDKGFTMIELIIVIAIMGILAAILVPSFTQMTRKSRLKGDISTIRNLQTQMELYVAEHDGEYPTTAKTEPTNAATVKEAIKKLADEEYLKKTDVDSPNTGVLDLQTTGAVASYDTTGQHIILDVSAATDAKVKALVPNLGTRDKTWITSTP